MTRTARPLDTVEGGSILNALEDNSIVGFDVQGDTIVVEEQCDGYFRRSLTKTQFAQLITELQALQGALG
jgi:hypothetical protein